MNAPSGPVAANDWSVLVPEADETWTPHARVSICVPTRNPGPVLARTLRCLAAQTYPTVLFEVVIADDGSDRPIDVPDGLPYEVTVVHQERTSDFGAGRARNLAARAASGDVLFFLDDDVIPERQVVESYARWFSRHDLVVPMGLCRFVDMDEVADAELVELVGAGTIGERFATADVDDQHWRERHFSRTRDLRDEAIDAFRVTVGATIAVGASLFADVGGFPELGVRGVEDTAFGYRLHNDGGIFVLDRDAQHWHQGPRNLSDRSVREQINNDRAPYVESVIPIKGFRDGEPPASPPVEVAPVVRVRVHGDDAAAAATKASIVELDTSNLALTSDPLGVGADSAFLQVDIPAGVLWTPATLRRLVDTMAQHDLGVIKALVAGRDGEFVTISRTRAIRRAVRVCPDADPVVAAGELFGTWWTTAKSLEFRSVSTDVGADGVMSDGFAAGGTGDQRTPIAARLFDAFVELLRRAST